MPSQVESSARPRIVLLGASNAAIGVREAADALRARHGGALELICALGHGRSYGTRSSFLVRSLPGIVGSGLWDALAARPQRIQQVLLADVGNDLVFGTPPETVLAWVETALDRLEPQAEECVLMTLPLANLRALSEREFEFWRRLLFPRHGVGRGQLLERAEEVDAGLRALASKRGHRLVAPERAWYARDPIHFRRSMRKEVWRTVVGEPSPGPRPMGPRLPPWWRLVPERRWILGRAGGRPQPDLWLADGTSLALY